MFGRLYDEVRDGNDRHASGKEDPRVLPRPGMLERDGNGNKNKQPVDVHGQFTADGTYTRIRWDCWEYWNTGMLENSVLSLFPHHSTVPIFQFSARYSGSSLLRSLRSSCRL